MSALEYDERQDAASAALEKAGQFAAACALLAKSPEAHGLPDLTPLEWASGKLTVPAVSKPAVSKPARRKK